MKDFFKFIGLLLVVIILGPICQIEQNSKIWYRKLKKKIKTRTASKEK